MASLPVFHLVTSSSLSSLYTYKYIVTNVMLQEDSVVSYDLSKKIAYENDPEEFIDNHQLCHRRR